LAAVGFRSIFAIVTKLLDPDPHITNTDPKYYTGEKNI
jgi:hypothetical protein